jgi:hypothetical protein
MHGKVLVVEYVEARTDLSIDRYIISKSEGAM